MSLIETYQGRKSLFAQKLITKGVTASATDGLTTLINKIDDIGDTFSGLLLNGDKTIAQRGDTVTLSMMLLDDAELQYNTDVTLYENTFEHTYSSATTINEDIGEDYEIVIHSGCFRICGSGVTPANGAVIQLYNNYLIGYNNGNYMISPRTTGTNRYRIKNGVLSYGNTSFDLSSYDIDFSNLKECIEAGKVTVYTSTVVNTGSDGVATYDYTCTGVGEKTFFAKSGIFQSKTFVTIDAKQYVDTTSDWYSQSGTVTQNTNGEWVIDGYHYIYNPDVPNNQYGWEGELSVEFDIISNTNGAVQFYNSSANFTQRLLSLGASDGNHIKLVYDGSKVTPIVNGEVKTSYDFAPTGKFRIGFTNSLTLKNIVIY